MVIMRPVLRGALAGVAVALCMNGNVHAQPAPAGNCPLSVRVDTLAGHDDETVFSLWADDRAGRATGSLVVYAGNLRYRVPFADAVAADDRNTKVLPTPIVVRFDRPARVDSAYVASLNDAPCIIRNPFVRSGLQENTEAYGSDDGSVYPTWSKAWKIFLELAADAAALPSPKAETVDAPDCDRPYVTVHPTNAVAPVTPNRTIYDGRVVIALSIDTDGSLLGLRVEKSSHLPQVDAAAVDAAQRSRFAPQMYRCQAVTGASLFDVRFSHT
jgi:TonB family protein